MSITIDGLDDVLHDYMKYVEWDFYRIDQHNLDGNNIHISWTNYNNDKCEKHIDLTTLLIYANKRAIIDREKIEDLNNRLESIEYELYQLRNR